MMDWYPVVMRCGPLLNMADAKRPLARTVPALRSTHQSSDFEIRYNSPEVFQALIRAEMAERAKVIRTAGIRVD